ncbi:MAG TPA: hypothetical protein VMW08_03840 [Acidimicrobiales bacterium]|nr:hypothetical protein [Acidimicrobiales bacterium]
MTRRDLVLVLVAPALLVVVAATSIWRFHDLEQSSWQGVGFGMFATYDNVSTRSVRVEIDGERFDPPADASDLVDRALTTPFGPALGELHDDIVRRVPESESIEVSIWRIHVMPGDGELVVTATPIRSIETVT